MGDPAAVRHYELLRTYLEQTPLAAWMLMPRMRGGLERSAWRSVSENKHDSGNNNDEHDIIRLGGCRGAHPPFLHCANAREQSSRAASRQRKRP